MFLHNDSPPPQIGQQHQNTCVQKSVLRRPKKEQKGYSTFKIISQTHWTKKEAEHKLRIEIGAVPGLRYEIHLKKSVERITLSPTWPGQDSAVSSELEGFSKPKRTFCLCSLVFCISQAITFHRVTLKVRPKHFKPQKIKIV